MNLICRFFGHIKTLITHKHYVFIHCCRAGIPWRGLVHDLSKFTPTEFIPGVRYYTGIKSPNEGERAANGFSLAWMHHKGRNKHHNEYWIDYNMETKLPAPVKMPVKYVKEMYCDRLAACKTYHKKEYTDNDPLKYYNMKKDRRDFHPETAKLLQELLEMLAQKGEKETFAYIRKLR